MDNKIIHRKRSIATELISIFLIGIVLLTSTISAIFIVRMRALSTRQTVSAVHDNISAVRNSLILTFQIHEDALRQAASGIALLYERTGASFLGPESITETEMRRFLMRIKSGLPNVAQVFMSNNIPTFEPGGYAVFAPEWRFGEDYDQRTRPWYRGAVENPETVNFTDPYMAMATGIFSVSLSTIIYDYDGNNLGVIILDIAVNSLSNIVSSMQNIEGLNSFLLNNNGLFISHEDNNAVMRDNFFDNPAFSDYKQQILNEEEFFIMNHQNIISSARIPGANWVVVSVIPTSSLYTELNQTIQTTVFLAIALLALLFFVLIFFIRRISKPIVTITEALKTISEGEGDLSLRINVNAKNEVGDLAKYFNNVIEYVLAPMCDVKDVVNGFTVVAKELSYVCDQLLLGSNETVDKSNNVTKITIGMSESVSSVADSSKEISDSIKEVASTADDISIRMESLAKTIEEMSKSVGKIADNAGETSRVSIDATKKAKHATEEINKLEKAAIDIDAVTQTIKQIANKTNLLALNASVEAARAGDAGKGFAVVADEVKLLANLSANSADDIAQKIADIQNDTVNVAATFNGVSEIIFNMNKNVDDIVYLSDKQAKASNEMANNVSEANAEIRRVANSISEVSKGSQSIAESTSEVSSDTIEVNQSMVVMNRTTTRGADGANIVNDFSDKLKNLSTELTNSIGRLKFGCADCKNKKCYNSIHSLKDLINKSEIWRKNSEIE
ncbi:MAG: methyl-accepting chemotaxis protein [Candidatus Cloacimonetes bacterium]|nr:methyl-accepting chemotaxis protein [Candidatus Cloacimonadota bacterium]